MSVFELVLRAVLALCAVLAFGACDDDSANEQPGQSLPPQGEVSPEMSQEELVSAVTEDLALRLGIPAADITLAEFCYVTWPDGSLGVAEPGQVYTQALVEGWLVILEADGEEYRYHGAGNRYIAANFVADAVVLDTRCP